jgi:hypothetical protein
MGEIREFYDAVHWSEMRFGHGTHIMEDKLDSVVHELDMLVLNWALDDVVSLDGDGLRLNVKLDVGMGSGDVDAYLRQIRKSIGVESPRDGFEPSSRNAANLGETQTGHRVYAQLIPQSRGRLRDRRHRSALDLKRLREMRLVMIQENGLVGKPHPTHVAIVGRHRVEILRYIQNRLRMSSRQMAIEKAGAWEANFSSALMTKAFEASTFLGMEDPTVRTLGIITGCSIPAPIPSSLGISAGLKGLRRRVQNLLGLRDGSLRFKPLNINAFVWL